MVESGTVLGSITTLAAQTRQHDPDILLRGSMTTGLAPKVANRPLNRVFLSHGFSRVFVPFGHYNEPETPGY